MFRTTAPAVLIVAASLAFSISANAQESLEVSFETSEAGGKYAPRNVVAVWVEDAAGAFVKTIGRWSDRRTRHLVAWVDASGEDADAVSGATRSNHNERLTVTWDMLDRDGAPVPDGVYTVRMELADLNADSPDENNQGAFTFEKNGTSTTNTDSGGGFNNVSMNYTAGPSGSCGDGVLDQGETCDPAGSCPTECGPPERACVAVELTGSADTCTAECVERAVNECNDDDGCCPAGCDLSSDSDCDGSAPSNPEPGGGDNASVGCHVGSEPSRGAAPWLLATLTLMAFGGRRRRRQ